MYEIKTTDDRLKQSLEPVLAFLKKQKVIDALVKRQHAPRQDLVESLVHRQQLVELAGRLRKLHSADVAYLLEILPPDERLLVWSQIDIEDGGDVLWDVSKPVAEQLIAATGRDRLVAMCRSMNMDELGQIAEHIPDDVMQELLQGMNADNRDWLQSSISYPENSAGYLMSNDFLVVNEDTRVQNLLEELRGHGAFPEQTDKLFVVDRRNRLKGVLPLTDILLSESGQSIGGITRKDAIVFSADDTAHACAQAFERYDLISAPVVDAKGKLIGRLTVDVVMDFVREQAEDALLRQQGLSRNVDLFTPVWNSARERWVWLCINLLTAFVASRVISIFEGTIAQLVALAALMPIVASIGGNSGNQTVALFIRGLALKKITPANVRFLALKEIGVSAVNGVIWGGAIGVVTMLFYRNAALGGVMALATLLNLVVAAVIGIVVPVAMQRAGRDPALGSSVLLTFGTDGMGFLIFLGLASWILI